MSELWCGEDGEKVRGGCGEKLAWEDVGAGR